MGVAVRRYIDILIIIITFPYSTCISSFFGSSVPTSLFILKMFFRSCICIYSISPRLDTSSLTHHTTVGALIMRLSNSAAKSNFKKQ